MRHTKKMDAFDRKISKAIIKSEKKTDKARVKIAQYNAVKNKELQLINANALDLTPKELNDLKGYEALKKRQWESSVLYKLLQLLKKIWCMIIEYIYGEEDKKNAKKKNAKRKKSSNV